MNSRQCDCCSQLYTIVKVGGGMGQGPATEVTHLRLNQPPFFPSILSVKTYTSKNK